MVPRPPSSKLPRVLIKKRILRNSPRPSKSESLEMGPRKLGICLLNKISLAPSPRQLQCTLKDQCNGNFCFYLNDFFLLIQRKKIILQRCAFFKWKGYQFDFKVTVEYHVEKDLGVTFWPYASVEIGEWCLLRLWEGRAFATPAPKTLKRDICCQVALAQMCLLNTLNKVSS